MTLAVAPSVRVHGWTITSELPIAATSSGSPADMVIRVEGTERLGEAGPPGVLVLDQRPQWDSTLVRTGETYRYRVGRDYEVTIDEAATELVVMWDCRRPTEVLAPVISGGVIAIASTLRGRSCLHATTIALEERAVAIVGPPGAGKTTTAGLLIEAGGRLVGDDVLAPIDVDGRLTAPRGLLELRFRESASDVADRLPAARYRRTPDGRIGVVPEAVVDHDRCPLVAIVIPILSSETDGIQTRALSNIERFRALTGSPRIEGWRDPRIIAQEFHLSTRLADSLPVIEMHIGRADSLAQVPAMALRTAIEEAMNRSS